MSRSRVPWGYRIELNVFSTRPLDEVRALKDELAEALSLTRGQVAFADIGIAVVEKQPEMDAS